MASEPYHLTSTTVTPELCVDAQRVSVLPSMPIRLPFQKPKLMERPQRAEFRSGNRCRINALRSFSP